MRGHSRMFRSITRWVCVFLVISAYACADTAAPPIATGGNPVSATAPAEPFYFYQGQKIFLTEETSGIVVAGDLPNEAVVREILAASGTSARGARPIAAAAGHWFVELDGTPSLMAALKQRAASDARLAFVAPLYSAAGGGGRIMLLDRVAVRFRPGVTRRQVDSLNAALGTRVLRPPRPDSGFTEYWLSYPRRAGSDPLSVAAALATNPLVAWADPDKVGDRAPHYLPSDPYFGNQWHLRNTVNVLNGVAVDLNLQPAWDLTLGAATIKVAIIDDGVDVTQQDMTSVWNGGMGYDLFYGNGYSDDVLNPFGNDTHGTSVAGIIGAAHNNSLGVAGIAPNVIFRAVRMFRGTQVVSDAQIANGIAWAASSQVGADVINNSWGGGSPSNAITNAIVDATTQGRNGLGTVVVFAAGNTSARGVGFIGQVTYPGTLSTSTSVITVGAINRSGGPADYTPGGSEISLVGVSGHTTNTCVGDVVTTDRWGTPGCNDGPGGNINFTTTFSGTSAAAPQVAGIAALILSREPGLSASQVKTRLQETAIPWGASGTYGAGKVDAYRALIGLDPAVSIGGPESVPSGYTANFTAITVNGTAPFTYTWRVDGFVQQQSSSASFSWSAGSSYNVSVTAVDAVSRPANGSLDVSVCPPPQIQCLQR